MSVMDEDDDQPLPDRSPWMICPTCHGNGRHSLRFGAITQEDRQDWDPEEFQAYCDGEYDETCATCNGSGKIRESQLAAHQERLADRRLAMREDGIHDGEVY
jgi:hypothetical protein